MNELLPFALTLVNLRFLRDRFFQLASRVSDIETIFRLNIQRIGGYTPGEQPQEAGWVKLNTNENPYPPSPHAVAAIVAAASGKLNLYPDPLGTRFREAAANLFGVDPDWILPTNGSDEVLTIITRSFAGEDGRCAFPYPSYILYETLADLQGAPHIKLPLNRDWSWPAASIKAAQESRVVYVPNPNSPSGNCWSHDVITSLIPSQGVLVLDEAYGDFADTPHRAELVKSASGERVIVTRSFSKSYSLAGIRFGFAIARPEMIAGLRKVKDSYNCDTISLAAATAAIEDQETMQRQVATIRATRQRLGVELTRLGFEVIPSQANFVWCSHPTGRHREIYEGLKANRVLVRYMRYPGVPWASGGVFDGLRITIGTDDETNRLLEVLGEVLKIIV